MLSHNVYSDNIDNNNNRFETRVLQGVENRCQILSFLTLIEIRGGWAK